MAGPMKRKDGKTDSGKIMKKEQTEGGKRRWGGRERFIIGALNVISSCFKGLELEVFLFPSY